MNRRFAGVVLITMVIGILFIAGDIYPAIRTYDLEGSIGIPETKAEEMLQEITKNKTERGMTGSLANDLDKALWFSSNKETIRAKGEVFQDLIGYSEVRDLKTEIQRVEEAITDVTPAKALILSRPVQDEIKMEIARRGLEKKSITEKTVKEPLFSMLRGPEQEEVSVPISEDSALPYTSILLVSMIIGSLVSFALTCTWCTWAFPAPGLDVGKEVEDKEEMPLAA